MMPAKIPARHRAIAALLAASLLLSVSATARPSRQHSPRQHNPRLLAALRGVDQVPSAAVLRRAAPVKPADQLAAIARDVRIQPWLRLRAVSVLPSLGVAARGHLIRLADTVSLPPRMRWWAVYGWLRRAPPGAALNPVQRWLRSSNWRVREAVVRGLRHQPASLARPILRAHRRGERHPTVRAALRHVLRHLQ